MKKILIGLLALGSISSFAEVIENEDFKGECPRQIRIRDFDGGKLSHADNPKMLEYLKKVPGE